MKILHLNIRIAIALFALTTFFQQDTPAQQSISDLLDIPMLLSAAEKQFDLAKEDAVILFDGQKEYWLPDNRLITFVHRIIWINSETARDHFGDHQILYDHNRRDFNPITVRTWRDGQWWETGETGIVETLPEALAEAYDYTNMREMMLLHDGIELPCILEVAFYIEDKQPFRRGMEGVWTFAREEPSVQTWFGLGLPEGQKPNAKIFGEILSETQELDDNYNLDVYWWKAGPLDNLPRSGSDDPTLDAPYIAYSTWESWGEFGSYLDSVFNAAMNLDDYLKKAVDSLVADARTDAEKANLVAEFVNTKTRYIDYPETYWISSPRPVTRVYSTAYGHRLDRAMLAGALFRQAGLAAKPIFISKSIGSIQKEIPTLGQMQGIGLWLTGDFLKAYYDPAEEAITYGNNPINARSIWQSGIDSQPAVIMPQKGRSSVFDLQFDLSYDKDKNSLSGTGFLQADNAMNPYGRMLGLEDEAITYLNENLSGLVDGAEVTGYNLSVFNDGEVIIGFEIELEKPETDFMDRLKIVIGEPSDGIGDLLPDNIRIYEATHFPTIKLPGLLSQQIKLQIDLDGLDIMYAPDDKIDANEAGSFSTIVVKTDDRLSVTRKLELSQTTYKPADWPALKELLLAEDHERNKTLLFKIADSDKK